MVPVPAAAGEGGSAWGELSMSIKDMTPGSFWGWWLWFIVSATPRSVGGQAEP